MAGDNQSLFEKAVLFQCVAPLFPQVDADVLCLMVVAAYNENPDITRNEFVAKVRQKIQATEDLLEGK